MAGSRRAKGFTLLELLISLTILSVMMVLILGAFRIGARAWEKGETDVAGRQRHRIVLELIRSQLASICRRNITVDGKSYSLQGTDDAITFASDVPLNPGSLRETVLVSYRVEPNAHGGERLSLFEKRAGLVDPGVVDWDPAEPDTLADYPLIPESSSIRFSYLGSGEAETPPTWTAVWDGASEESFPQAVRVDFVPEDGSPSIRIIARTHASPGERS